MPTTFRAGTVLALVLGSSAAISQPALAQQPGDEETKAPACPPNAVCETIPAQPPEESQPSEPVKEPEAGEGTTPVAPAETPPATKEGANEPITIVLPPSKNDGTRVIVVKPDPAGGPPEIIEYRDEPEPVVVEPKVTPLPAAPPPPDEPPPERERRVAISPRVSIVAAPEPNHGGQEPRMGGLGVSLRYRPVPVFAIDASIDAIGGIDANGYERIELPVALTGMIYLVSDGLVQPYLSAGINASRAEVQTDEPQFHLAGGTHDEYTYVGGHAGVGLELRVSPLVGLYMDGSLFVRQRVDDNADEFPEFVDRETGEGFNTSAAGLVRGGLSFWF